MFFINLACCFLWFPDHCRDFKTSFFQQSTVILSSVSDHSNIWSVWGSVSASSCSWCPISLWSAWLFLTMLNTVFEHIFIGIIWGRGWSYLLRETFYICSARLLRALLAGPGRPPPSSELVGTWTTQVMTIQAAQLSKTALFAVPWGWVSDGAAGWQTCTSLLCVQWPHIDSLKSATTGAFTPWKSANAAHQDPFPKATRSWLVNVYQHTTDGA